MRCMLSIHVAPHCQAGDKLTLAPRTSDFYDVENPPEPIVALAVTDAQVVEIEAAAGNYWLTRPDGPTISIVVPAGHEPAKPVKRTRR